MHKVVYLVDPNQADGKLISPPASTSVSVWVVGVISNDGEKCQSMEWKFAERSNVAKLWPSKSERQLTILELSRFEEEDGAWLKAIKDIVAKGGWVLLLPELFSGTEFVLSQGQTPESTEVMHGFVQTGIFGLNPNAPNEEPLTFLGPDDNPYNSGDVHAAVALRYGLVLIVPEIDYKNLEESPRYDTGRFIG